MKRILVIVVALALVWSVGMLIPTNAAAQELDEQQTYSGTFYYDQLGQQDNGAALQQLYNRLDAAAMEFHFSASMDAVMETVDTETYYAAFEISFDDLAVDMEEAVQVWMSYKHDHPLYYWIDTQLLYGEGFLTILTTDEYDTAAERGVINARLDQQIQAYLDMVAGEDSAYQIALAFHDAIIQTVDYARTSTGEPENALWAHSVVGVLDGTGAVCEGYAQMFQLLLNAAGVENIFVVGGAGPDVSNLEAHAWNMVKLEDGAWYWCDLTWDDMPSRYLGVGHQFFCVTDDQNTNWLDGGWTMSPGSFVQQHHAGVSVGGQPVCEVTYPERSATVFADCSEPLLREAFTVDGLTYALNGYGTVQLIQVSDTVDPVFQIPETVIYNGKSYTVNAIGSMDSNGLFGFGTVVPETATQVILPRTIRFIWDFAVNGFGVEEFIVDADNPYFTAKDGVLFTKSLYTLIAYPRKAPYIEKFIIPDETHMIAYQAFYYLEGNFSEIVLGKNVTAIGASNWGKGYCDEEPASGTFVNIVLGEMQALTRNWGYARLSLRISVSPENATYMIKDNLLCYTHGRIVSVADTEITEIILPDGITTINESLFSGCYKLTSVTIPSSVTSIGNSAFAGCSSLASITIPNGVTSIGNSAFAGCSSLTSITIPKSVTVIADWAFAGSSSLWHVLYTGTEENWNTITIGDYNGNLAETTIHYNCTGDETIDPVNKVCEICNRPDIIYQGTCGDNLTWTLDENGLLTISGTGEMTDGPGWPGPEDDFELWLIKEVIIEEGITSIADQAFYFCSSMTSVHIPDSVTSIGKEAFSSCSSLTSVTISDHVTHIGAGAFAYCERLNNVKIGKGVISIGDRAFYDCISLTRIVVDEENTVYSSDSYGVLYNKEQTVLLQAPGLMIFGCSIPDSVTTIAKEAFAFCSNLSTLTIPDHVTSIGDKAFYYCSDLTSIVLPESLTSIGEQAFYYCGSLTEIHIPAGVTSIGDQAFYRCSSLTGIWVDSNNTAFSNDGYGVLFNKDKTVLIAAPGTLSGGYTVPQGTVSIYKFAFTWCENLTNVTIADGVTEILRGAFTSCANLTQITIPTSVTIIDAWVFQNCDQLDHVLYTGTETQWNAISIGPVNTPLESVTIHYSFIGDEIVNGVCTICNSLEGSIAFGICGGTADGILNSNLIWTLDENGTLKIIGKGTMRNFESEEDVPWANYKDQILCVVLEEGVTSIGTYAFQNCKNLARVSLPESMAVIGEYAFAYCEGLTTMILPTVMPQRNSYAFEGCMETWHFLYRGTYEQWVEYYGSSYFHSARIVHYNCTGEEVSDSANKVCTVCVDYGYCGSTSGGCPGMNLSWLLDVNGVLTIFGDGFMEDYSDWTQAPWYIYRDQILAIVVQDGVTYIGHRAFYGCSKAASVSLADSITHISSDVFAGCSSLETIVIPQGVTYIDGGTFSDCSSLTSVVLGDAVTDIGAYAFAGCTSLTDFVIPKSVNWIGENAFANCASLKKLEIPANLQRIGANAFTGCAALEEIVVDPGNATYYSINNCLIERASKTLIRGCHTSVIPTDGSVTAIGACAFSGCTGLTELVVPDTITSIGEGAFSGCTGLESITLPFVGGSATENTRFGMGYLFGAGNYDNSAYEYPIPESLKTVIISNACTVIGEHAFHGCTGLTTVVIGNNVTTIEAYAFYQCTGLTQILIPGSVTTIGGYAFSGCTGLTQIVIPDTVITVGSAAFSYCEGLTTAIIGNGVQDMGNTSGMVFGYCTNLTTVVFRDGASSIGIHMFSYCTNLTSITIPDSVTSIEHLAFFECPNLWHVLYQGTIEQWKAITFASDIGAGFYSAKLHYQCTGMEITDLQNKACTRCDCAHEWELTVLEQPNCKEAGLGEYFCPKCNDIKRETLSKTDDHKFGDWTRVDSERHKHTCSVCQTEETVFHNWDVSQVTTQPTCTQMGVTTYTCSACGDSYVARDVPMLPHTPGAAPTCTEAQTCTVCQTVLAPANGHSYTVNVTVPTCTKQGYTTYLCHCGASYVSDYTNPNGHSYSGDITAPTCTEQGYTTYTCYCGDSYKDDYVDALGHAMGDWTQTKAPSCAEPGQETQVCVRCSAVETRDIAPRGHVYTSAVTAPTCTSQGYTTYNCAFCNHSYTADYTDATGHNYDRGYTEPTCTEDGYYYYYCPTCGDEYVEFVEALGHNIVYTCHIQGYNACCSRGCGYAYVVEGEGNAPGHNWELVLTKEPTCSEQGYYTVVCSGCDFTCIWDYIDPLPHTPGAEATCTTSQNCTVCHAELAPAKGHTPGPEATCTEDQTCTVCHIVLNGATGHSYASVTTAPTCTAEGYTTHTCSGCGASYTSDHVAALGHSDADGNILCDLCGELLGEVKVELKPEFTDEDIPEDLQDTQFDTVEKIEEEMQTQLQEELNQPELEVEDTYLYDAVLMYQDQNGNMQEADREHFPEDGKLTVTMPIPEGTDPTTHKYHVVHMFTTDAYGKTPGDVEIFTDLVAQPDGNGGYYLTFEVTGLSPIMICVQERSFCKGDHSMGDWYVAIPSTATTHGEEHRDCENCDYYETRQSNLLGDVNGDGRINTRDAKLIMQYELGLIDETKLDLVAADVNGDGRINTRDAKLIMQLELGLIEEFPAPTPKT